MLYAFFWVILRRLKFICRCFGTFCLFYLHRLLCLTSTIHASPQHALSPSHTRPRPPCGSLPSTTCFHTLTHPYPFNHLPNGSAIFKPNLSCMIAQHFSNLVHCTHNYLPMKMRQSVPKRRHINFRHRGFTQKKAYNKYYYYYYY